LGANSDSWSSINMSLQRRCTLDTIEMESKRSSAEEVPCVIRQRNSAAADVNVEITDDTCHAAAAAVASGTDVGCTNTTSKEAERRLMRVLTGCLDNLPPLQSKIVRIFTSSTFTGQKL